MKHETVPFRLSPEFFGDPTKLFHPAVEGDAGVDLYCTKDVSLAPGERALIPTGVFVEVPRGYELQIRPKSGLAWKQGFTVLNAPGTIDSGYRGEIMVIGFNANPTVSPRFHDLLLDILEGAQSPAMIAEDHDLHVANNTVRFLRGDKVAQAVLASFVSILPHMRDQLTTSDREAAGFGSTGR